MEQNVQHVFLIGAKSLGTYGGYETFVKKLTERHQTNSGVQYHVACKANGSGFMDANKANDITNVVKGKKGDIVEFVCQNARCFMVHIPERLGSAQAVYYDVKALEECYRYICDNNIAHPIVYIMACRIGPFISYFYKKIHKVNGRIYINPDGHEWLRTKWNRFVRKYWKISERMMVRYSDMVVCDSINIEKYIHESYDGKAIGGRKPKTVYIAYGAETRQSMLACDDRRLIDWYKSKDLKPYGYYMVCARCVPENNYEIMIREFMNSHSMRDFVLITDNNEELMKELESKLHFRNDKRIKFVGTVYDQELLMKIREKAYGNFHGHEVGGTNPSLLEALSSTDLNLLLDVGFNREVAGDAALYWNKKQGNLSALIDMADGMENETIREMGRMAKERIREAYSWDYICDCYAKLFLG